MPPTPLTEALPRDNIPLVQIVKSIEKTKRQAESPTETTLVPSKRRKQNPGTRIVRGKVYDSINGTCCHQCRQKTTEESIQCTRLTNNGARCNTSFCRKCGKNRYAIDISEILARALINRPDGHADDTSYWLSCPVCDGLCNCSICRKKKELAPTGILAHFTKQNGVSSVLDLKQSNPKALEKLKPLKSIHAAPKEVKQPITIKRQQVISEPPIFEPIDIPDDKIWWHRLEIREFVIRFASLLKIQPKHLQTFNDLQAEWSNLALKNLIVRLLRIIYNDGNPTFDDEMLLKTHKEIEKQSADKEFIWTLLRRLLESAIRLDKAPGQLNEEERLWMVICLIDLVLDGESIRKQMEHDIDTLHTLIKSHTDKTKTIKEEYSNRRSELFAKRVQMKTSQWQSELEIFMKQHTALLQPLEFKLFERSRELSTKTGFLGEDYHGTRYYVLSQRPRNTNRNWGSYLLALSEDGKWQRIVDGIEIIKCAQWVRTSATVYCPAINKPRRGGTTSDSGVIADQTSIGEISTMMKAIVEVVVVEIPPRTRESIIDCAEKIERLGKYVQFKWPMKEDQLNAMAAD